MTRKTYVLILNCSEEFFFFQLTFMYSRKVGMNREPRVFMFRVPPVHRWSMGDLGRVGCGASPPPAASPSSSEQSCLPSPFPFAEHKNRNAVSSVTNHISESTVEEQKCVDTSVLRLNGCGLVAFLLQLLSDEPALCDPRREHNTKFVADSSLNSAKFIVSE